jgi:phospholipid/cholesterol/gamma-HCH transport system substrate-binding protein
VTGIRIVNRNTAEVSFDVLKDRSLPTSTIARLRYRNLVGQRYIALEAGAGDPHQVLPKDGTIPVAQTQNALDLTVLFQGFQPLFEGLDAGEINSLSMEIIQTLQGEGSTVDVLFSQVADLTNSLADRDQVIGDLITNLNSVLQTVSSRDDELANLINQLQRWVSGLAADRQAIGDSINGINALTTTTSTLLTDIRPSLKQDIVDITQLAQILNAGSGEVAGVIQRLPNKVAALTRTATYGSFFNFYLCQAGGQLVLPAGITTSVPNTDSGAPRCQS